MLVVFSFLRRKSREDSQENQEPVSLKAQAPSGNAYGIQTDNEYYILLIFMGDTYDETLEEDLIYLRDFYFSRGFTCVSVWFKAHDIGDYLSDSFDYYLDKTRMYYVFYNDNLLRTSRASENIVIHYPSAFTEPTWLVSINESNLVSYYKVFEEKGKVYNEYPPIQYMLGQYFGYVERDGGVVEHIYAYYPDIE